MWEWIHDLSCWLFHQPHSADWWLVAIALGTALVVWLQLKEAETTRRASHRALPHVEDAEYRVVGSKGLATVQLRLLISNAGPGAAIDVYARAWLVPLPADTDETVIGLTAFSTENKPDSGSRAHFQGRAGLFPPGRDPKWLRFDATPSFSHTPFLQSDPKPNAVAFYQIGFFDVFEQKQHEPPSGLSSVLVRFAVANGP